MISIVKHSMLASELLGRKLGALRSRLTSTVAQALNLDENYQCAEAGGKILLHEGACAQVSFLISGVVGEVRPLSDGRRQILGLRYPGDMLEPTDSELLVALTPVRTADGATLIRCLADGDPEFQSLRRAWVMSKRVDQAILRDHVVRLGRMSAYERTAHFLLEAHERIGQVGLASESNFHLPLTQEMLSDVIGLSVVHLNRTLQALKRSGLVVARQGYVTLSDRDRLVEIASYVSRFPAPWKPAVGLVRAYQPRLAVGA